MNSVPTDRPHLLDAYQTPLLETTVLATADGIERRHRIPGESGLLRLTRSRTLEQVPHHGVDGQDLLLSRADEGVWAVTVPSERTLADLVLSGAVEENPQPAEEGLHAAGRGLRLLHGIVPPTTAGALPAPAWITRAGGWLAGLDPDFHAAHAVATWRQDLGAAAWRALTEAAGVYRAPGHLVHGAPGMGALVIPPTGTASLVTGPWLAMGDPITDVGYLVGELLESTATGQITRDTGQRLLRAFLEGYGLDLQTSHTTAAALRILVHQRDWIALTRGQPGPGRSGVCALIRHLTLAPTAPDSPPPAQENI